MDRIDKIVFILPFITLADMASTEYSLAFGGKEGGILAKPIYEQYGKPGLVVLSIFTFFAFLVFVWLFGYAKKRITQGQSSKLHRVVLVVLVIFFFWGEAYLTGVVIQNFLVPLRLPSLTLLAIQYGVAFTYFVSVSFFTRTEMKRLMKDLVRALGY